MKLLHYTSVSFAGILLVIISVWAAVFYYAMLDEIYDSIDDGLDNQKGLVIGKAASDTTVLHKNSFDESDYAIREIPATSATGTYDTYIDTIMYMQNEKSHEPVRMLKTVFAQDGRYYQLQVATSMVEEDDLIQQLFYYVLGLYFGLVTTIILFNNFLLKKIWRPFYRLLKRLKKFRLDKPEPVCPEKTNVDEFRMLIETIQKLLQRNIDVYNSQKDFIENASHELQTPLAISINKLEALAESNQLAPAQLALLSSAMDNLGRLTRLNKSLLLLSKIENKQFAEKSPVSIARVTRQIAGDFSDQAVFNQLQVSIDEKDPCIQQMNADLAAILVTNLVKNAIVHNQPGGFVHITIDKTMLSIENAGDGPALDEQKIFSRFHTAEPAGASTGLGLAIVKAIAGLYQFKAAYRYSQKHIITILFG